MLKLDVWTRLVVIIAVLAGVLATVGSAAASPQCAPGKDACVVVNSPLDTDARDGVLTLREAMMVLGGSLDPTDLTMAERQQVAAGSDIALHGDVAVYFDPAVFCATCGNAIVLAEPPALGEPDRYTGDHQLTLPPILGEPDASEPPALGEPDGVEPPALGEPDSVTPGPRSWAVVGMGVIQGQLVPASVVVDGSALSADHVGMWLYGKGTLQGLTLRGFGGTAIEVDGKSAAHVLVGSDGDGVNDANETVHFENNFADVVVLEVQ